MYFGFSTRFSLGGESLSSFDVILVCDGLLSIFLSVFNMLKVIKELDQEDRLVVTRHPVVPLHPSPVSGLFKFKAARFNQDELDRRVPKGSSILAK
jgi:hypothetical protein